MKCDIAIFPPSNYRHSFFFQCSVKCESIIIYFQYYSHKITRTLDQLKGSHRFFSVFKDISYSFLDFSLLFNIIFKNCFVFYFNFITIDICSFPPNLAHVFLTNFHKVILDGVFQSQMLFKC